MTLRGVAPQAIETSRIVVAVGDLLTHADADGVNVRIVGMARRRRAEDDEAQLAIAVLTGADVEQETTMEMDAMITSGTLLAALQQQQADLYRDASFVLLSSAGAVASTVSSSSTTSTTATSTTSTFIPTTPEFGVVEVLYRGQARTADIRGLPAGANYELRVVAVSTGGEAAGNWTDLRTADAVPEGALRPVLTTQSATAVRVQPRLPRKPNGAIIAYRVMLDGVLAIELTDNAGAMPPPSVTLTDLLPYTRYAVAVAACTTAGCATGAAASARTLEAPPTGLAPPSLRALSVASVAARWQPPAEANGVLGLYRLWQRSVAPCADGSSGPCPTSLIAFGEDTFAFTVLRLAANRTYEFQVEASNGAGSVRSAWASVKTLPALLPAPSVLPLGNDSIAVSWEAPPLAQFGPVLRYELRRDGEVIFNGTATEFADTGLVPGTAYTYTLRTRTETTATESASAEARTFISVPDGIATPTCTAQSATTVAVAWSPPTRPNGDIVRYFVQRDSLPQIDKALALSHLAEGLAPYGEVTFRVFACTELGCRASARCELRTPEAPPTDLLAPEATVTAAGDTAELAAQWAPPATPNGVVATYTLELRVVARSGAGLVTDARWTVAYTGPNLQAATTVAANTQYALRVTAFNGAGNVTSAQAFAPGVSGEPGMPLVVGAPLSTEVQVAWSPAAGFVAAYEVQVAPAAGGPFATLVTTATAPATLSDLTPSTAYRTRIVAVNAAGSQAGAEGSFTTADETPPPEGFGLPTVAVVSATVVTVSWEAPAIPHGTLEEYRVARLSAAEVAAQRAQGVPDAEIVGDVIYRGGQRSHVDKTAVPATTYAYYVVAVNLGGAARGADVTGAVLVQVTTLEALPTGLAAPVASAITSSSAVVSWDVPAAPNGAIQSYRLEGREIKVPALAPDTLVDAMVLNFTTSDLLPYTEYEFRVVVANA